MGSAIPERRAGSCSRISDGRDFVLEGPISGRAQRLLYFVPTWELIPTRRVGKILPGTRQMHCLLFYSSAYC